MNDFERNKRIAELVYPDATFECVQISNVTSDELIRIGDAYTTIPDYCGDWARLMPLVVKHGINLMQNIHPEGYWTAFSATGECENQPNKNPQRALADCLLKVLEAKANEQCNII